MPYTDPEKARAADRKRYHKRIKDGRCWFHGCKERRVKGRTGCQLHNTRAGRKSK